MLDQTDAALIIAQVTMVDSRGVEQTATVDERGVAVFENLNAGHLPGEGHGRQLPSSHDAVQRASWREPDHAAAGAGDHRADRDGRDQSAADRRDNGFTQTLSQEEIDSLPDDPDEMAEELARMAGPGAQIFVNGFRGGRLPPKDQIQQIRFHTNSFSAEYHEAGMIRVEVITKPGHRAAGAAHQFRVPR